jgi:hypothetical protein
LTDLRKVRKKMGERGEVKKEMFKMGNSRREPQIIKKGGKRILGR